MAATVLIIDDSPEVLAVVRTRLRPDGYRLITTTGWRQGIESAVADRPDAILLDMNLPEISGLDICRRLKADARTRDIPVIFLTASDDVALKIHSFDLGAVDYVTKPFHPEELRARVRVALRAKRERDALGAQAALDPLTGLCNRGELDRVLHAELAQCERTRRNLAFVMIDLDHFKRLNDTHGHPAGDLVLSRFAKLLADDARRGDHACRYGGEEFALILPETSAATAVDIAERVRDKLRATSFAFNGGALRVTASFGVADAAQIATASGGLSADGLIGAADQALYEAKHLGRDCVVSHTMSASRLASLGDAL